MTTLVTGGAGYIGSHMVRALVDAGREVTVLDDLSAGKREAVHSRARFVHGDVRSADLVRSVCRTHGVTAVLHFAGRIRVDESVTNPRKYWEDNLAASIALFGAVADAGVRDFVFSSTAAVYGEPSAVPIDEDHPTSPVNPYGESKLAFERVLATAAPAARMRWAALRYFNAAGAHVDAGLGEHHEPESHLVPIVIDTALGRRPSVSIFGTDWPTPDGTCVRDYVHVEDLADAHLAAIDYLGRGGDSVALNLGTGRGHSVREVIDAVKRVSKRDFDVRTAGRREGDPPMLVASAEKAARVLGWRARRSGLDRIVSDAWLVRSSASSGDDSSA